MKRILKSSFIAFVLGWTLSLVAYQVAMNTWAASNFVDGYTVMTLTGAWKAASIASAYDPAGSPWALAPFNSRRIAIATSSGNTASTEFGFGCNPLTAGSISTGAPDAQNALHTTYNTSATINTTAGLSCANFIVRTGRTPGIHFQHGMALFDNGGTIQSGTNSRVFIGVTDQTKITMTSADDPAGNYAGFQYSSGTANWQCITKDNTTQDVDDSGISVATETGYEFDVVEDTAAGDWNFYIDGSLVCSMNTNPPTSGTNVTVMSAIRNKAAEQKVIRYWWMYVDGAL